MSIEPIFHDLQALMFPQPELRKPEDLTKIQALLLNFHFFQQIQRDYHINNLVDCAIYFKYRIYHPREPIFTTSDSATFFYLLLSGEVTIFKAGHPIRQYNSGPLEECCLVERRKYDIDAIASVVSHVLYLDYQIYSGLLADFREKRRVAMASFLRVQPEFKSWTIANLMGLSYFISELSLNEGDVVYTVGDPADRIFIVQDGSVVLATKEIKVCRPGDVLGLDDLSRNLCRRSKCISQSRSTLLYVFKHDYLEKKKKTVKLKMEIRALQKVAAKTGLQALSICSFAPEENSLQRVKRKSMPIVQSARPVSQVSQRVRINSAMAGRQSVKLRMRTFTNMKFY
jgi:CRP-like cAMP-binding protein